MKKAKKIYICKYCYQRKDCDRVPSEEGWCVYYKKDHEMKSQEANIQNITDTIEMSKDEIKSIVEKIK